MGGLPGEHTKGLREIYGKHSDCQLKMDLLQPDLSWDMSRLEWLEVTTPMRPGRCSSAAFKSG